MCNWSEAIMEKGMEKGLLFGKAGAIIELLEDVGEVPDTLKDIIMKQDNMDILKKWNKAAAKAQSIEDFERAAGLVSF